MNNLEVPLFLVASLLAVASSLGVILAKRLVHGVLCLTLTMIALAILYAMLGAHFVAMIQLLIYAGAIVVLFLLVIMLLGIEGTEPRSTIRKTGLGLSFILGLVLAVQLGILFKHAASGMTAIAASSVPAGTIEAVAAGLFGDFLVPFELVSVVLLLGIMGVVMIAGRGTSKQRENSDVH